MATLDRILDAIMPWLVGLGLIGFFIWLLKEPFKLMFNWAKDLLGYGKDVFQENITENPMQIVYR
ncbi:MAG TPA: hypothetical protein VGB37_16415 [Candidatus Lokiarchaeia archaeon]